MSECEHKRAWLHGPCADCGAEDITVLRYHLVKIMRQRDEFARWIVDMRPNLSPQLACIECYPERTSLTYHCTYHQALAVIIQGKHE